MSAEAVHSRALDERFLTKVFYGFAAIAAVSLAINLAGHRFGGTIALAGHTPDPTMREIVIGNDVVVAPANAIRFDRARRDGVASRLELYLRWPDMTGYTEAAKDDFNAVGGRRSLVYLSFEPRAMSRDMSGRFDPIYRSLIVSPGVPGGGDVLLYGFTEKSGYLGEVLAVAEAAGSEPLVARCLTGAGAAESLAPCERDIHVGEDLSLTYRFPQELLANWRELESAVRSSALAMVRTRPR